MLEDTKVQQIAQSLNPAQSIIIAFPDHASLDQTASALALAAAIKATGREVLVVSPAPVNPKYQLEEADIVQTQLGNRDLTVSFAYRAEAVDKVSYHIDEEHGKFNLVVKPQKGQKPLTVDDVEYSYTSADADLVFLIGVHDFEDLQQLYFGFERLYQEKPVVSFHSFATEIGSIKVDASGTSSLSETMVQLIQSLGLSLTSEASTNLLAAIEQETDNFRSLRANANTFATVAELLRAGGRRTRRSAPAANAVQTPVTMVAKQTDGRSFADGLARANSGGAAKPNDTKKPKKNGNGNTVNTKAGDLHHQPSGFGAGGGG